jgi:hypothetical protein
MSDRNVPLKSPEHLTSVVLAAPLSLFTSRVSGGFFLR